MKSKKESAKSSEARKRAFNKYNVSVKGRYNSLKYATKKRKDKELAITIEQYIELVHSRSCYYCSGPLGLRGHGLDRIDNNKGYYPDNVVPCCGTCNQIRNNNLTHVEMIAVALYLKKFREGNSK